MQPDSALATAVAMSAQLATGSRRDPIGVAYWMDMALFNAAGIPAVAFGPSGAGAHADVEWVDLSSLEACAQTYLRAAAQICGQS